MTEPTPQERRALAAYLANQLNTDELLTDEVRHLLTNHTIQRLYSERSQPFGAHNEPPRPQFDPRPIK